jgi:hypothetical protein
MLRVAGAGGRRKEKGGKGWGLAPAKGGVAGGLARWQEAPLPLRHCLPAITSTKMCQENTEARSSGGTCGGGAGRHRGVKETAQPVATTHIAGDFIPVELHIVYGLLHQDEREASNEEKPHAA